MIKKMFGNTSTYKAEEGMTWSEWTDSTYNTDGYHIVNGVIVDNGENYELTNCSSIDTIIDGNTYSAGPHKMDEL